MKRLAMVVLLVGTAGAAAGRNWWRGSGDRADAQLVLYGNVDLRQVQLAFNNSERIAAVLVQEGDRVQQGQVLARLDTTRLEPQLAQADAQAAAQRQVVERLRNGSRPEEIAQARAQVAAQEQVVQRLRNGSRPEEIGQARANVESAKADAVNARQRYDRASALLPQNAISRDEFDAIKAGVDMAEAKLVVSQKLLDLAVGGPRKEEIAEAAAKLAASQQALHLIIAGPRKEEIAQAEAQGRAAEAQAALLRQQLADAKLTAPVDAVVRTRILEPGEMASPQRPVFSLAMTDPKWVRAYVSEPDLGNVRSGQPASVAVDAYPGRSFDGWVGFVSPVAEFTPKAVQTEELRTSLVYEVRVFVKDPSDSLRLGMPATIRVALGGPAARPTERRR